MFFVLGFLFQIKVVSTLGDRPWAGLYTSNVKTRPSNVKTGWVEKVPAVFQWPICHTQPCLLDRW